MRTYFLGITTFKKPNSLDMLLNSLPNIRGPNSPEIEEVNVADDDCGSSIQVVQKYQDMYESGNYPFKLSFCQSDSSGSGIGRNKNRNIKCFLERPKASTFIAMDDDIHIKTSTDPFGDKYFLDHIEKILDQTKLPHLLTYISWDKNSLTGAPYFQEFPPRAEDEYLYYVQGAQGIFLVFTREAVEKAGYFPIWPYRYGYEHIAYSAAVNRLFGRAPILFPVIKASDHYFSCNNCPNNYEVDKKGIAQNGKKFEERVEEINRGLNLRNNKWE